MLVPDYTNDKGSAKTQDKSSQYLETLVGISDRNVFRKLLAFLESESDGDVLKDGLDRLKVGLKSKGSSACFEYFSQKIISRCVRNIFNAGAIQSIILSMKSYYASTRSTGLWVLELCSKSYEDVFEGLGPQIPTLLNDAAENKDDDDASCLKVLHLIANVGRFVCGSEVKKMQKYLSELCENLQSVELAKAAAKALLAISGDDPELPIWGNLCSTLSENVSDALGLSSSSPKDILLDDSLPQASSSAVSLSQIFSSHPKAFKSEMSNLLSDFMTFIESERNITVTKGKRNSCPVEAVEKSATFSCSIIKLVATILHGLFADDEDATAADLQPHFRRVVGAFLSVIYDYKGDLFGVFKKTEAEADILCGEVRLIAGKKIMKLARHRKFARLLSPNELLRTCLVAQDIIPEVRLSFAKSLQRNMTTKRQALKWICGMVLMAIDPDANNLAYVRRSTCGIFEGLRRVVRDAKNAASDSTLLTMYPESILPQIIWLVAHHPEIDADADADFIESKEYLSFLFDCLMSGPENYASFLHQILNTVLLCEDATDDGSSNRLKQITHLGIDILRSKEHGKKWNLVQLEGKIALPTDMFRRAKSLHAKKQDESRLPLEKKPALEGKPAEDDGKGVTTASRKQASDERGEDKGLQSSGGPGADSQLNRSGQEANESLSIIATPTILPPVRRRLSDDPTFSRVLDDTPSQQTPPNLSNPTPKALEKTSATKARQPREATAKENLAPKRLDLGEEITPVAQNKAKAPPSSTIPNKPLTPQKRASEAINPAPPGRRSTRARVASRRLD